MSQDKALSLTTLVPTSRVEDLSYQLWSLGILGLQELPPDAELYRPQAGTEFREPQKAEDWTRDEKLVESAATRLKIFFPDSQEIFATLKDFLTSEGLSVSDLEEILPRQYIEEYRKRVQGRSFGADLWIGPPWVAKAPNARTFIVDPGMAFGTGEHPTTQMIVEWLAAHPSSVPLRILDLGTGSGILAIAARRFNPQAKIVATDLDPNCAAEVPKNFSLNALSMEGIELLCGDAGSLDRLLERGDRFDLILSNIYGEVLAKLCPDLKKLLQPQGTWVATGVLDGPARQAFEASLEKNFSIKNSFQRRDAVPNDAHLWLCYELSQ